MVWFAFSLQNQVEKYGAYVGIAAFFGLAVLSLLYFSQARELKRLREWAGRAPERARELEQRVVTQATSAVARRPTGTVPLPQRPAPPRRLAEMPAPSAAAAQATSVGQATELAEPVEVDPATNGNVPGPRGPGGSVPVGPPAASNGTAPATPEPVPANGDAAEDHDEQPEPAEPEPAAPAGAFATATTPAAAGETGEEEAAAIPRATPEQRPAAAAPRPAPLPLRQAQPAAATAARRPAPAARRPAAAPPQRTGRSAGTIALFVGLAVLVLGGGAFAISQFGGSNPPPKPNQSTPPSTGTSGQASGGQSSASTTPPAQTTVSVLNGTTVQGLARKVSTTVSSDGFKTGTLATNTRDQSVQQSTVFFADGFRTQARRVARLLNVATVKPVDSATQALAPQSDVVVLAGADLASR